MKQLRFYKHATAIVETDAIGSGTRIWAFAHVLKGAKIGRDCNIGDHVFIETGAIIGDRVTIKNGVMIWDGIVLESDVFVGPNAVFTNDPAPRSPRFPKVIERYQTKKWLQSIRIKRGASIGANATILCGLSIGRFALVGAGAVVTRNVPDHALAMGVPAEVKGWVSETAARLEFDKRGVATCPDTHIRWRLAGKNLRRLATDK